SQTEFCAVGNADSIFHTIAAEKGSDGAKQFVFPDRRAGRYVTKNCWFEEKSFSVQPLTAEQNTRAHLHCLFHLRFQSLEAIFRSQRPNVCRRIHWVANL